MNAGQPFDAPLFLIAVVLLECTGLDRTVHGIVHSAAEDPTSAAVMAAAGFVVGFIVVAGVSPHANLLLAVLTCLDRADQLGRRLTGHRQDRDTVCHVPVTAMLTAVLFAVPLSMPFQPQ